MRSIHNSPRTLLSLLLCCAFVCALVAGSVNAITTGRVLPTINTTFAENITITTNGITEVKTGDPYAVDNRLYSGSAIILAVTQTTNILSTSLVALADAAYKFTIVAADISGNAGAYPYLFDVKYAGQKITVIEPSPYGGTTSLIVNLTIQSEFASNCAYNDSNTVVTTDAAFQLMRPFPEVLAGNTTHRVQDVLTVLNRANQPANVAVPISIACKDNTGRITPLKYSITYTPGPPTPCVGDCPGTPPLQDISLQTPANGRTTAIAGDLVARSEKASTCKWDFGDNMITDASQFAAMRSMQAASTGLTHTQVDFFRFFTRTPVANETISVVVSCSDTKRISSEVFAIVYDPGYSTPTYQTLTLLSPNNGTTRNTTNVLFSVGSERNSVCKYAAQKTPVTTKSGYDMMSSFPQSGALVHSLPDLYTALRSSPQAPTTSFLAVTCLENGFYTATVFTVNYVPGGVVLPPATYQDITLIEPQNGITNSIAGALTVGSERTSTCRWSPGSSMITTPAGFAAMPHKFTPSDVDKKTHTQANFFTVLGYSPAKNETISVVVTCNDTSVFSSEVFSITYNPDFVPTQPEYQQIVLLSPATGTTTTTTNVAFSVGTDRASVCKYEAQPQPVTTKAGYDAMKSFAAGQTGNTVHTIADLYKTLAITPAVATSTPIAVTCLSNGFYTATVFTINYRPNPVDPLAPRASAIIVTEIDKPIAYITVKADQDIWCSLDARPLAGAKAYDTFNKTVSGNYTEPVGSNATNRTVNICCENRAGLSTCFDQDIVYRFSSIARITVTSPPVTSNSSYQLRFQTDTQARCTARAGTSTSTTTPVMSPLTLTPATTVLANDFTGAAQSVQTGTTTYFIECITELGGKSNATFSLSADRTVPRLDDIIVQAKTCDLKQVRFTFNATDPAPSSGLVAYQYQLFNSTGSALTLATNSTDLSVTAKNLKLVAGTQLKIRGIVWDGAGNPSAAREESITVTDESDVTCDRNPPEVRVVQLPSGSKTNASLFCTDDGSGCLGTFRYGLLPVNQTGTCTVLNTTTPTSLTQSIVIDKESYLCYLVPDRAGNELRGQARIAVNRNSSSSTILEPRTNVTDGSCTDGIKNSDETGIDCGGYRCGNLLGKTCGADVVCKLNMDCTSGVCSAGVCGGVSCENKMKDGTESDVDCGGTCGACLEGKTCTATTDCVRGTRCINNECSMNPETNEPSTPEDDEPLTDSPSGSSIWKLLVIALGVLLLLGGVGGAVLYDPTAGMRSNSPGLAAFKSGFGSNGGMSGTSGTTSQSEPFARFGAPGREHGDELTSTQQATAVDPREQKRKRESERRVEREQAVKAFETAGDLTALPTVTHEHLEQAAKDLPPKEMVKAVKTLASEERVTAKDAAIAIKDLEHSAVSDEHDDAIAALRKHFNIEETEKPETSTKASTKKADAKETKK